MNWVLSIVLIGNRRLDTLPDEFLSDKSEAHRRKSYLQQDNYCMVAEVPLVVV